MARAVASRVLILVALTLPGLAFGQSDRVLTIAVPGVFDTMDPHRTVGVIYAFALHNVLDTLTAIDEAGELVPALATSWEMESPTSFLFRLRQDVQWHDGSPFTAQDVVYTYERASDQANPYTVAAARRLATFVGVDAVDDFTVRITISEPNLIFPRVAAFVKIISKSQYETLGEVEASRRPLGTGPYRVTGFVPDEEIQLEAADNTWRNPAQIRNIRIVGIPEATVRGSAIRSGDVDMIMQVSPDQVATLEAAGLAIVSEPLARYITLMFGLHPDVPGHEILQDKRVRDALVYAIDRQAIVETVLGGHSEVPREQFAHVGVTGFNPNIEPFEYDPDRARQLLDEAGFHGPIVLATTTGAAAMADREVSEAVAGMLSDVIEVDFQVLEPAVWRSVINEPASRPALTILGYTLYFSDPQDILLRLTCEDRTYRYCNPDFDAVLYAAMAEGDIGTREELLQEASQILADDTPGIWLYREPQIYAYVPELQGIQPNSEGEIRFSQLHWSTD